MLDIKKVQSKNIVTIVGTLSELSIEEKSTADGRDFITGTATIRVDQEVNGKVVENEVPVHMFSMKLKKDGTPNAVYSGIAKMKDDFISLAAAETPSQASRVMISSGNIQENMWLDKTINQPRTGFQLSSNFMRKAGSEDQDTARFELTGVVGDIKDEIDKNGEETGRIIVKFITVGYLGKTDVLQLIAENQVAVEHIRAHWEKGDTVSVAGVVNMSYSITEIQEEQGFGEPIKRILRNSKRELIITSGSPCGLDEELSYDSDAIKLALDERQGRIVALSAKKETVASKPKNDFGF